MSSYGIHVPAPDDHDYHADLFQERRRRAFKSLDISDVLATVDDLIASEPDPAHHPLFPLTAWLLDCSLACHGGELFDRCKALILTAIDRCVADALARED